MADHTDQVSRLQGISLTWDKRTSLNQLIDLLSIRALETFGCEVGAVCLLLICNTGRMSYSF